MSRVVTEGAPLRCDRGTTPAPLAVPPSRTIRLAHKRLALVSDHRGENILPFGMCSSMANPQVAAATSAAQGVLTPQPCVPAVDAPWGVGAARARGRDGAMLHEGCAATCRWGGRITIEPGSASARVDHELT